MCVCLKLRLLAKGSLFLISVSLFLCFVSPSCLCMYAIISVCVCVSVFLSHEWVMVWSWCGEFVCVNSCPLKALILGMLETVSVPLTATRRALYPGLLWGSPLVVPVFSSAWKSPLSGVWNPWVCMATVDNLLGTRVVCLCVFVCLSQSVSSNSWETMINRDRSKGPESWSHRFLLGLLPYIFPRLLWMNMHL